MDGEEADNVGLGIIKNSVGNRPSHSLFLLFFFGLVLESREVQFGMVITDAM